MTDERYTFEQARLRLEEIAVQARKKDTTLEKSLDLLEEGARLALMCTDLVDHTDFSDTVASPVEMIPEAADTVSVDGEEADAGDGDGDQPEAVFDQDADDTLEDGEPSE